MAGTLRSLWARLPSQKASIAVHQLRRNRSVSGVLDEGSPQRARGWVYDARRPNVPIDIEIVISGDVADRVAADLYRSDLAELLIDEGFHGFDLDMSGYAELPSAVKREVRLQVADSGDEIGVFELPPNRLPSQMPSANVPQDLHDRLSHIFDHITATHEALVRHLDAKVRPLPSEPGPSLASLLYGGTGVGASGQFASAQLEETVFEVRLETALMRERLSL